MYLRIMENDKVSSIAVQQRDNCSNFELQSPYPEFQLDQDPRLQKSHLGLGFLDGNSQLEQRNQK